MKKNIFFADTCAQSFYRPNPIVIGQRAPFILLFNLPINDKFKQVLVKLNRGMTYPVILPQANRPHDSNTAMPSRLAGWDRMSNTFCEISSKIWLTKFRFPAPWATTATTTKMTIARSMKTETAMAMTTTTSTSTTNATTTATAIYFLKQLKAGRKK